MFSREYFDDVGFGAVFLLFVTVLMNATLFQRSSIPLSTKAYQSKNK